MDIVNTNEKLITGTLVDAKDIEVSAKGEPHKHREFMHKAILELFPDYITASMNLKDEPFSELVSWNFEYTQELGTNEPTYHAHLALRDETGKNGPGIIYGNKTIEDLVRNIKKAEIRSRLFPESTGVSDYALKQAYLFSNAKFVERTFEFMALLLMEEKPDIEKSLSDIAYSDPNSGPWDFDTGRGLMPVLYNPTTERIGKATEVFKEVNQELNRKRDEFLYAALPFNVALYSVVVPVAYVNNHYGKEAHMIPNEARISILPHSFEIAKRAFNDYLSHVNREPFIKMKEYTSPLSPNY
ncbi:TPA: hypothetical protein HA239_05395 [Candidatus Woesearchaeota archaeon]|nr:hypothetical protein QT06_C0001G0260 [archaeon GW2011_AR15]MBS3103941.1 hypothetical protein [Candidatus Woesearchaeota archaeon]HIH41817.1 hypothetical protein [Candidatus Woesearchaeota archaeon]